MCNLSNLKSYLKEQAALIRSNTIELKKYQKEHKGRDGGRFFTLKKLSRGYRHHHIAYSMLRGKSYEAIEKPNPYNKPNMDLIQEITDAYTAKDVCASQK